MNVLVVRVLTALLGGIIFFATYYADPVLFCGLLLLILFYILFFEWRKLMGGLFTLRFWLISPLYPILPMLSLAALVLFFWPINFWFPLTPYLIAWVYDTAAFTVGMAFGMHHITPILSPGKTWEGLAGGFLAVLALNFFTIPYMGGFLPNTLWFIIPWSVVATLLAFNGDLLISWLKRRAWLKDTGYLLPGHGGLLDRFDSVMLLGPVLLLLVYLFNFVFILATV
jgi:phosphatidate cytidylyltransferase